MISLTCVRCVHSLSLNFLLCIYTFPHFHSTMCDVFSVCYRDTAENPKRNMSNNVVYVSLSFILFFHSQCAKSLACMQAVNWMTLLSSTIFYGWKNIPYKWMVLHALLNYFSRIFLWISISIVSKLMWIRSDLGMKSILCERVFHTVKLQYFCFNVLSMQKSMRSIRKRKQTTKQITVAWKRSTHCISVSNHEMSQLFQCGISGRACVSYSSLSLVSWRI